MGTATHADPDALLARFRASGTPRDLGELFDATSGDLHRVALATAPDAAAAEDAVQETFLAVICAAPRWDPSRRAMPWLLGILRFKIARLRERARRPAAGTAGDASRRDVAAPEIADGDPEAAAQAWAEIERLDEPYRAVALLRWRYGLTPAEIAHVRGEAPGTTRSLLSRALERVRTVLKVVPAVMVLTGRPARGLDAVRADIVSAAAVAPRTIAVSGGSLGGRALVATALVAAVGAAGYFALRPDPSPPSAATETADIALASATLAAPPARPIPIGAPGAAPVAAVTGPSARGRVVDEAGHPIRDAVISSVASDAFVFERPAGIESDLPAVPPSARTARTDADGRFAVTLDDAFPTHLVFVTAPGRAPKVVAAVRPGADVAVVLDAGEVWGGRVLDGTRAPIAGARVRACVVMPWFAFVRETTTDVSGAFRFEAMPTDRNSNIGSMPMNAWLTGSATGFAPAVLDVPTAPGSGPSPAVSGGAGDGARPWRNVEIVLRRGARLSGRVVDADSGTPVAGADVRLTSTEMGRGWIGGSDGNSGMRHAQSPFELDLLAGTRADATGEFTFEHVPCLDGPRPPAVEEPNDHRPFIGRLAATAEGYATGEVLIRRVEDGGSDTREVRLWRPARVEGRVVDRDGKPLAGRRGSIEVAPPTASAGAITTDADGRFRVEGVPAPAAGVGAKIRVWDDAGGNPTTFEIRGGTTTTVPDIVIDSGRRPADLVELRIQVVDAEGAPIWGAGAQVWGGTGEDLSTDRTGAATASISAARLAASESIEVAAWAPGYARATVRKGKDAATRDGIVVRLETGRRIAGVVRLADGTPAVGAVVRARRADASSTTSTPSPANPDEPVTRADARGAFVFEELPDDSFTIVATGRGESHASPPTTRIDGVRSGATGLVLQLPADPRGALGRLEVSVVDEATNAPLDRCTVRLRRGERESIWARPIATGRYDAREIPPGVWSVRVFLEGYALEIVKDVAIDATPRPAPLEVRLHRAPKRLITVTGGAAAGAAKDLAFAAPDGDGAGIVAKGGADDRYVALGLKGGTYRVTLGGYTESPPGPMVGWVADGNLVEVPAGDAPFEIRLVPAGALTLHVDDPDLAAAEAGAASVSGRERSEGSSLVVSDDRGRVLRRVSPVFRSGAEVYGLLLVPGTYRVRLERPGEAAVDAPIEVPEGVHVTRTIGSAGIR